MSFSSDFLIYSSSWILCNASLPPSYFEIAFRDFISSSWELDSRKYCIIIYFKSSCIVLGVVLSSTFTRSDLVLTPPKLTYGPSEPIIVNHKYITKWWKTACFRHTVLLSLVAYFENILKSFNIAHRNQKFIETDVLNHINFFIIDWEILCLLVESFFESE